jgi:hypothetical protein
VKMHAASYSQEHEVSLEMECVPRAGWQFHLRIVRGKSILGKKLQGG